MDGKESAGFLGRHRRGLLAGAAVLAGGWVVAIAASYGLSRDPEFCGKCHYEEPFVEEWASSSHASVPCARCHDGEGFFGMVARQNRNLLNTIRYVVGAFEYQPRAEVHDGACLASGCHEDRKLTGPVKFQKTIDFDHKGHLDRGPRGVRMQCVSCHSRIVQGEHMTVTREACYLCHFKGLPNGVAVAGCKCHGTPDAPVEHRGFLLTHEKFVGLGMKCSDCHLDVTEGDGAVPPARCNQCHLRRDVREYDRATIHDTHVTTHDIACDRCHEPIEHRQVKMVRTLEVSCATCHTATHDPHRDMYMGVGATGVDPLPDVMFKAQVGCDGCHRRGDEGAVAGEAPPAGTRAACVSCHGAGYDRMLDQWQTLLRGAIEAVKTRRAAVDGLTAGMADPVARAAAQERLDRADANLRFITAGRPEHNVLYSERILASIQADLDAVFAAARPGEPAPPDLLPFPKEAVTARCTEACHSNMDKVLRVRYEDLELSHRDHIYKHGLECMYCHDNSKQHGAVRLQRQQCIHCHHVQQTAECGEACHRKQAAFIRGEGGFDVPVSPDPMAGQVSCAECHEGIATGHDPAKVRDGCVGCHDEKYGPMPATWQAEVDGRVLAVQAAVRNAEASRAVSVRDLVKAKGNLSLVVEDRSRGAHNPGFARKLLEAALRHLAPPGPGDATGRPQGPAPAASAPPAP